MITDSQTLKGAKYGTGDYAIKTYDDGFGPLWISRNSIGINGIVRAQTWETAYEICEDEFFPEADESMDEIIKEYGFKEDSHKVVKDSSVLVAGEYTGVGERFAVYPDDYPNGKLVPEFVRWETVKTPDPEAWMDNELFQEAFGFRNSGPNTTDTRNHGIYQKDMNGDSLDRLTPEMLEELRITLEIEGEGYEVVVGNIGSVYKGTDKDEAGRVFDEYRDQSKSGVGRAGNESVTLFDNNEIDREHEPEASEAE